MKVGFEPATPIGVYDHPSPPEAAPQIGSVEVANVGVIPLLYATTGLVNKIYEKARSVLQSIP